MTYPVPPVPGAPEVVPPPVVDNPAASTERTFTATEIARARQEEKDKLYPRLTAAEEAAKAHAAQLQAMQSEIAQLSADRQAREAEAAQRVKDAQDAAKAKANDEMSAKELLAESNKEWQGRFDQLLQERERDQAILQKEREFAELQNFTQRRVAEESENIAPELLDLVAGNTREEIEASLSIMKAKTAQILEGVQGAQQFARMNQKGVSLTGYSTSGPMDNDPANQTVSATDLQNMSMSKYAELRGKLGIGNSGSRDRGLFG